MGFKHLFSHNVSRLCNQCFRSVVIIVERWLIDNYLWEEMISFSCLNNSSMVLQLCFFLLLSFCSSLCWKDKMFLSKNDFEFLKIALIFSSIVLPWWPLRARQFKDCSSTLRKWYRTCNRIQGIKTVFEKDLCVSFLFCLQYLPTFNPSSFSVSPSVSAFSSPAWSCPVTDPWISPGRKMEGQSPPAWVWLWTTSTLPAHCASPTWHQTTMATTPASPAMRLLLLNTRVSSLWEVRK